MESKMQDSVILSIEHNVATLFLNRPEKRNAFDDQSIQLFSQKLQEVQQLPQIQVLIIRGKGEQFCAGADIHWMKKMANTPIEENRADAQKLAELLYSLYHLNKPTIAVLEGSVFGGGLGLVAASDIVIAESKTQFCFSEVRLGLIPAVVAPYVIASIGSRWARRYMLTAEVFGAAEAYRLGLVHQLEAKNSLETALAVMINRITQNGPHALGLTKDLIHTLSDKSFSLHAAISYTANLIAEVRSSTEAKEGLTAFLEKREPRWQEE